MDEKSSKESYAYAQIRIVSPYISPYADGYLDMQVERPGHSSGERAVIEEYQGPYYMLWNPEESIFEIKGEHEVSRRLFQNQRQKADETEYVVQPGDTLWAIAKEFY